MTEALAHYSLQKLLLGILDVVAVNRLGLLQSNLGMRGWLALLFLPKLWVTSWALPEMGLRCLGVLVGASALGHPRNSHSHLQPSLQSKVGGLHL